MRLDVALRPRLAQAKVEGRRVIDALRFRDEMAVIAAGSEPYVAGGLTGHQRTLLAALDKIEPSDGPDANVRRMSISLARRLLGDARETSKVDSVLPPTRRLPRTRPRRSSGRRQGYRRGRRGDKDRQRRDHPLPSHAAACSTPSATRVLADGRQPLARKRCTCRLRDRPGSVTSIDVIPPSSSPAATWTTGDREDRRAEGGSQPGSTGPMRLSPDNQAWAILPRRAPRPVTLVSEGDLFLEKVLEAIPLVELKRFTEPPPAATAAKSVVTVLHHKVPDPLPNGPLLVVDPAGGCALWDLGEPLVNPIVTKQDKESPLMAHVRLDNVMMPAARKLTLEGPRRTVLVLESSVTGDPLLCTRSIVPKGKVLVRGRGLFDEERPAAPDRLMPPILVSTALAWFTASQGKLRESAGRGRVTEIMEARPCLRAAARGSGCCDHPTAGAAPCPEAPHGRRSVRSTGAGSGVFRPRASPARRWSWPATWPAPRKATSVPRRGSRPGLRGPGWPWAGIRSGST